MLKRILERRNARCGIVIAKGRGERQLGKESSNRFESY
jgi:hypothetical protein